MAAPVGDSRVSTGKKPKISLKKKKKVKMVARTVASELGDEDRDAADSGGTITAEAWLLRGKAALNLREAGDESGLAASFIFCLASKARLWPREKL